MRYYIIWILIFAGVFPSVQGYGCTVCMGAKTGPLAEASNGAIFFMLGVLALVFTVLIASGYCLVRRGRVCAEGTAQLISSVNESKFS